MIFVRFVSGKMILYKNEDESYAGGVNKICLKQARQNYGEFGAFVKENVNGELM